MNKFLLSLFATAFSFFVGLAQPVTFQIRIGDMGFDLATAIKQTNDGGYIVTGGIMDPFNSNVDVFLVKLSGSGVREWMHSYGGNDIDIGYDVLQTPDSGYMIVGKTLTFGAGNYDIYLIRTNSLGDTLWTHSYGDSGDDFGNGIFRNDNGGYTITASVMFSTAKAAVLNIDESGTLLHQGYVDAPGGASPYYRGITLENGNIGITNLLNTAFAITDSLGVYQSAFSYSYNGPSVDAVYMSNGDLYILEDVDVGNPNGEKIGISKSDIAGVQPWLYKFGISGNDCIPASIVEGPNHSVTVLGRALSQSSGLADLILMNIDNNGTTQWIKKISTTSVSDHVASRLIRTDDGGYAIAAYVSSPGSFSDYDLYIIKTDSVGNSGCNEQAASMTRSTLSTNPPIPVSAHTATMSNAGTTTPSTVVNVLMQPTILCSSVGVKGIDYEPGMLLFPNPFSEELHLQSLIPVSKSTRIEIREMNGRLVLSENVQLGFPVNSCNLAPGIYSGSVFSENRIVYKEILVKLN